MKEEGGGEARERGGGGGEGGVPLEFKGGVVTLVLILVIWDRDR